MLLKYYGLDWLVFGAVLAHLWLLGGKRRAAFLFGMLASVFGVAFGVLIESVANAVSSALFFALHVRAYVKWGREPT